MEKTIIKVGAQVKATDALVWKHFTEPEHIKRWNKATEEWHTPRAQNDLKVGGRFVYRMEAKDGSMGFDFAGEYTKLENHSLIEYRLDDGRSVIVQFEPAGEHTLVTEYFEADDQSSEDIQRAGWQAILDNFKAYTESFHGGDSPY